MNSPKQFERQVAEAYRQLGAKKTEHDVELDGNQIDVYVELEVAPRHHPHRIAVEAKEWERPVGVGIVNKFAMIVRLLCWNKMIHEGVVVSEIGFTRPARAAAKAHGIKLLELSDLHAMIDESKAGGQAHPTIHIPIPPTPFWAPPYPLQKHFTGRFHERNILTEWLLEGHQPLFALLAMGGAGKSALSWVWSQWDVLGYPLIEPHNVMANIAQPRSVPEERRPEGLLWWSFYEREASFSTFLGEALIYASGGSINPAHIPSAAAKVKALVTLLRQRKFLLVLDGFERELRGYLSLSADQESPAVSPAMGEFRKCSDPAAADFLRQVVSLSSPSRVLLTSRQLPHELGDLPGCHSEDLTGLDPEEAFNFLMTSGVRGRPEQIRAACHTYHCDPLSLRVLAGVIMNDKKSPGDVRVAGRLSVLADLKGREQHHILQVAYDELDEPKRMLLSRIAAFCVPLTYDDLSLFNEYGSRESFEAALNELIERGVLAHDRAQGLYDLHPIVRGHCYALLLRERTKPDASRGDFVSSMPDALLTGEVHSASEEMRALFSLPPVESRPAIEFIDGLTIDDLTPVISLYQQVLIAGRYDLARELYRDRLADLLYYRFGAYQTCIKLLTELFTEDDEEPHLLKETHAQAWAFHMLANSYMQVGKVRRAARAFKRAGELAEGLGEKKNVALALQNLAYQRVSLGELKSANETIRRSIELCHEIGDEMSEAVGRQELGRLLIYRGALDGAKAELEAAQSLLRGLEVAEPELEGVGYTYLALCNVKMGNNQTALRWSRKGRKLVKFESNVIWAEWVMGETLTVLGASAQDRGAVHLKEAEKHLTEALGRCEQIKCVEIERFILISWARLHYAQGNDQKALKNANRALLLANECEYRLEQADAYNLLSRLALETGNREEARRHAEAARERALCDGPPYCYQAALAQAMQLLMVLLQISCLKTVPGGPV